MVVTWEELLKADLKGKIIILPTDTVYGIGCLLNDLPSVHKIYEIKSRDGKKPLAILAASLTQVWDLVKDPKSLEVYAKNYWPGALTLVAKKTDLVSDEITSGFDTVGIRVPNNKELLSFLEVVGPIVMTSLNISTEPAIYEFEKTKAFQNQVDYTVNGGTLSVEASTVYDTIQKKTLRQGAIIIS